MRRENYKCYSKADADALVAISKKTDSKTGVRATYKIKEFYLQEDWEVSIVDSRKGSCYDCLNSTRKDRASDAFICMDTLSATSGICCQHVNFPVSLDPDDRPKLPSSSKKSSRSKEPTPEEREAEIKKEY